MANVLAARSTRDSLFRIGPLSNKPLVGAVVLTIALQMLVIYLPAMQNLFGTISLGIGDLCVALVLSSIILWVEELWKWFTRRGSITQATASV
jgi:Ca2+-transporting ATPase